MNGLKDKIIKNYCGITGEDYLHITAPVVKEIEQLVKDCPDKSVEISFMNDQELGGYGFWYLNVISRQNDLYFNSGCWFIKDNVTFAGCSIR